MTETRSFDWPKTVNSHRELRTLTGILGVSRHTWTRTRAYKIKKESAYVNGLYVEGVCDSMLCLRRIHVRTPDLGL